MNSVPLEILDWSEKQPTWQRDALRRLFTTGTLTQADLAELLNLCKAEFGLSDRREAQTLAKEHLAVKEDDEVPVSLLSVTHHRGVNALAPEQTVAFGPNLTIVYGKNAAGKSGYTRILKRGCRSRFSEEILGNLLTDGAPERAQATIRFRAGDGTKQPLAWSLDAAPTGALAKVSVFDANCAPVYVRDKTDVAFRPFGLDVFDKLSGACAELRKRLESERAALENAPVVLPKVAEATKVAVLLGSLTSLTSPDDIRSLATLSDQEQARLKLLRDQRSDLQVNEPRKRAQELNLKAGRVELLAKHVTHITSLLGDPGLERLRSASRAFATAKQVLAKLRETVLTPDLLPGTGEEDWRRMWEAAATYSDVAYRKARFPLVSGGAVCLLCQQPIGAAAADRFKHFQELVSSTAQAEVRKAEAAYAQGFDEIAKLAIDREDISLALDEVRADDPALASLITETLEEAARIKAAVTAEEDLAAKGLQGNPEVALRGAAKLLRDRAAELLKQTPTMDQKRTTELDELEARAAMGDQLHAVLAEVDRKKRIAAYGQSIDDTNTQSITRKSTELTKRLITDRLRDGFQAELGRIEFTHLAVEIKAAGGARGTLFHQLVFTNAPGVSVASVLSEGESRALSLAAFFAELGTTPARSAIIFDDPVSSLDHIWRERIARRLVLEAKARQVIVFTHDLVFLKLLLDECGRQDIPYQHQYVRREAESAGVCSADLPWLAMRVKERIGFLRTRWQHAEKLLRTDGPDAYEREGREIYALLREAWEQAVGEVLLNDVVERYRPSVETKRARLLHDITPDDCVALDAGMTECSRWIRGHDHAAANGTPFPRLEELNRRIDDLEDWCKRIRNRRD